MTNPRFSSEVEAHLRLSIGTGHPSSGIDPLASAQLADAINGYGIHLVDSAFRIAHHRGAAIVGPRQVAMAIETALDPPSKPSFDWPAWLGGFFLGVVGNSIPDWFPFAEVSPTTPILTLGGLVGAAVCACVAVKRSLS